LDFWCIVALHVWGGISGYGRTQLNIFKGNVNKEVYLDEILESTVDPFLNEHEDIDFIWEHDHARAHASFLVDDWLEDVFGENRFTIMRRDLSSNMYAPSKMADIWWIERVWGAMMSKVYKEPIPRTLRGFRRRVIGAWKKFDQNRITRMIHETPARLNWIAQNSGKVIPNSWDYSASKLACDCDICDV
jgi:hypothetical protein